MKSKVTSSQVKTAIGKVNKNGILLVFPMNNKKEPHSLWAELHPRTKLRWEWDGDGDHKVSDMWRLMKTLSDGREVVYSKWYQGRATFFSRELFVAILCLFLYQPSRMKNLSIESRKILEELESSSPLSTKDLKKLTELQGKLLEPLYTRAMKNLFSRFLIVAFGEVDDGAFPSLAVGATSTLYEDLCDEASAMKTLEAQTLVDRFMPAGSHFRKFFDKILETLH